MTESIAATLVGSLRKSVRPGVVRLRDFVQGRPAARRLLAEVTSVERLIAGGQHPLHAAYFDKITFPVISDAWRLCLCDLCFRSFLPLG
jgi:hypothetical protein